jgi:tetratricopeptide (TPR) repeat protein
MVRHCSIPCAVIILCGLVWLLPGALEAQQSPSNGRGSAQQGVYVVFPFENAAAMPRLDWLSEGLEELTIQNLSAAGEQVYTHEGRAAGLERNGFPFSAKLSRAAMLRIAQELDADFVIFGSFSSDGKLLTIESRVLRVEPATLFAPVRESAPLESLMELHTKLVWQLLNSVERPYRLSLTDFSKAQRPLRLDAFEHYVRGLLANDDQARLRELREASRLQPNWPDPDFVLGETYFSRNDCSSAIPWLSHVPQTHARYAEALFAMGVCRLQMNQANQAEEIFSSLQSALSKNRSSEAQADASGADVPEILNNLAVARARQGKGSAAETDLRKATDLDPDEDDYPFNLGVFALRAGNFSGAADYFREASERKPENAEDRAFLIHALEKAGKKAEADQERESATEALGPNALPQVRMDAKGEHIERIKTELDTAALRLEVESAGPTAKPASDGSSQAADTTAAHLRRGRQELSAGRIDTAETEFRAALHGDSSSAAAHRGLGEIEKRRGKLDDAVKELQSSLQARDSAVVRTILARVYLEQRKPDLARAEAQRALKLAPNYSEAKELLQHLQNGKPSGGAQ